MVIPIIIIITITAVHWPRTCRWSEFDGNNTRPAHPLATNIIIIGIGIIIIIILVFCFVFTSKKTGQWCIVLAAPITTPCRFPNEQFARWAWSTLDRYVGRTFWERPKRKTGKQWKSDQSWFRHFSPPSLGGFSLERMQMYSPSRLGAHLKLP